MVIGQHVQEEDRATVGVVSDSPKSLTFNKYREFWESAPQPDRPADWCNTRYPVYVVQAIPRDKNYFDSPPSDEEKLAVIARTRCKREGDCKGTSNGFRSWGQLDRLDALHAIHGHYLYPNLSIARFRSSALGDFVADLIFEIDVHADVPERVNAGWYVPFIRVAVEIGRRLFDFLVEVVGVDPLYITTSVTRMGARVTVDWRAFGPRRYAVLLLVNAWVQSQVFAVGEVEAMGVAVGAKAEVDTRIYNRSDVPRSRDDGKPFTGSWLRPLGVIHPKSSNNRLWARTTPVPHERFHPDSAEWLTQASRSAVRDIGNFIEPDLFSMRTLAQYPEGRLPEADASVERLLPCKNLIELFEREDREGLAEHVRPDLRRLVIEADRRSRPRSSASSTVEMGDITMSTLTEIASYLGIEMREDGDKLLVNCPRPECKQRDMKGVFFLPKGVYSCFRCCNGKGIALHALARELGVMHLVPLRRQSSSPVQRVRVESVPTPPPEDWGMNAEIVMNEWPDLEAARADQDRVLAASLADDDTRIVFLTSGTGIGKTHAVKESLKRTGKRSRIYVDRDDAKTSYLELPDSKVIEGRRIGINCTNEDAEEAAKLGESVAETVCSRCSSRKDCAYRKQFEAIDQHRHLLLHHAHGPLSELSMFDNGADIEVVDEDALRAVASHIDLDRHDLDLFRVRREVRWAGDDIGLHDEPVKITRLGATHALEILVQGLAEQLSDDAAVRAGGRAAKEGRAADATLGKMLFSNKKIVTALDMIGQEDLDEHEQHRRRLLSLRDIARGGHGGQFSAVSLPLPDEFFEADNEADLSDEHLEDLDLKDDGTGARYARPPQCIDRLITALGELLHSHRHHQNVTSALMAIRSGRQRSWRLRLTERRPYLEGAKKIIVMSATMTAERAHLVFGYPSPKAKWIRHVATVPRKHKRIAVLDRSFSRSSMSADHHEEFLKEVVEVVLGIIAAEKERTGLPVAIIGPAAIVNSFNAVVLGKLAKKYKMPFGRDGRSDKWEELRSLTLQKGYISGYAGAVTGSNDYAVMHNGKRRFVRALVVLGSPFPNAAAFADDHRGLYAHHVPRRRVHVAEIGEIEVPDDTPLDWTFAFHTGAYEGTNDGDTVLVARNVPGFADERANEVLRGIYDGEVMQIEGRGRWHIDDPVDPAMTSNVYLFAPPVRGMEVDEVVYLDDLRRRFGLPVRKRPPVGRPPEGEEHEQLRRRWKKRGRLATLKWFADGLLAKGWSPADVRRRVPDVLGDAGILVDDATEALLEAAIASATPSRPK